MNSRKRCVCVVLSFLLLLSLGWGGIYPLVAFAEEDVFEVLRINRFLEPMEVPDFSLPATDGKEVKFSNYKGNVIFLNVWTTW